MAAQKPPGKCLRIGLTGGLASGKSTVLRTFAAQGATVVDADALARTALGPGSPLIPAVVALLGESVRTSEGELDRRRIADLVFASPELRTGLEALVHPEVLRGMAEAVRRAERASESFVVIDVPLLYEIGIEADFDRIIVVWCRRESQLRRAIERGMERSDAEARLDAQMSLDEKRDRADHVIDSETSLATTEEQSRLLLDRIRG